MTTPAPGRPERHALALALALGILACGPKQRPHARALSPVLSHAAAVRTECAHAGDACMRWGIAGVCIANRCVLRGACSYDVDCDDANPCTDDPCERGTCVPVALDGFACADDDVTGTCLGGVCVPAPPDACAADSDCASAVGPCQVGACIVGHCAVSVAPDSSACEVGSGADGTCARGRCVALVSYAPEPPPCTTTHDAYGYGFRDCPPRPPRYVMSDEDRQHEETLLEGRIRENMLYDVLVSLVPVGDGGYNIVVFNRLARTDVRGLVDPSFIAFEVGGFTTNSRWKSRSLDVWVEPYRDGWAISTTGGRRALRRGQAASGLGFLGVVNVRAFRTWLQRSFVPMIPPAPRPDDVHDAR